MDAPTNYSTPNETSWTYFKKYVCLGILSVCFSLKIWNRLLSRRGFPRADGTRAHESSSEELSSSATSTNSVKDNRKVFTLEELNEYDGSDPNKPIYICIRGIVFDVTKVSTVIQLGYSSIRYVTREEDIIVKEKHIIVWLDERQVGCFLPVT